MTQKQKMGMCFAMSADARSSALGRYYVGMKWKAFERKQPKGSMTASERKLFRGVK